MTKMYVANDLNKMPNKTVGYMKDLAFNGIDPVWIIAF